MRRKTLISRARGSSLMIALFVIVVFGILSVTLSSLRVDSQSEFDFEIWDMRAESAAEAALEIATYRMYPLGTHVSSNTSELFSDSGIDSLGGCRKVPERISFSEDFSEERFPDLARCHAVLKCERRIASLSDELTGFKKEREIHYLIKVKSVCKAGSYKDDGVFYSASKSVVAELIEGDGIHELD